MKNLYRMEVSMNEYLEPILEIVKFPIIKETPKGAWIIKRNKYRKWLNLTTKNRYAWATEKQAKKHFIIRKRCRNGFLSSEIELNNKAINIVKKQLTYD